MFPLLAPLVAGGITAIGDAISGNSNAQSARNAFKHRYQDTVADMKKAGLNPALAYGQGGGNPQTHDRPLVGEQVSKAAQNVGSATQANANAKLTGAQTDLLKAQTEDLIQQVKLRNAEIFTHTGLMGAQSGLAMKQQDIAEQTLRQVTADASFKEATLKDRIEMVHRALQQAGLNLTGTQLSNLLSALSVPEAKAYANYYKGLGKAEPYVSTAKNVMQTLIPRINIGGDRTFTTHNNLPRGK